MKLNPKQRNKFADICSDIAQVSLASIVVPFFIDKFDFMMLVLGLVISFGFWYAAMFVLRGRQ